MFSFTRASEGFKWRGCRRQQKGAFWLVLRVGGCVCLEVATWSVWDLLHVVAGITDYFGHTLDCFRYLRGQKALGIPPVKWDSIFAMFHNDSQLGAQRRVYTPCFA